MHVVRLQVAFIDPHTLNGARANRRLMEVAQNGTLFGESVVHRGILWFLQHRHDDTALSIGTGPPPEEEEAWVPQPFFLHGRSRLSRLVRSSALREAPAYMEQLCDANDCVACVLRPRPKRPYAVCLRFKRSNPSDKAAQDSRQATWEIEIAAQNLRDLGR